MDTYERVHAYLETLGMDTIEKTLENARGKSVMEVLDHLLSEEVKSKRSRRCEINLKYAGFPYRKTMDDFDFSL